MKNNLNSVHTTEFKNFCKKNLSVHMNELEKIRRWYVAGVIFCCILAVILICIFALAFSNTDIQNIVPICMFLLFFSITLPIAIPKIYKNKAKNLILAKLLSYFGDFQVSEDKNIRSYVKSLSLFDYFNRYSCDDRLIGNYGLLKLDISELQLEKVTKTRKGSSRTIIFQGILISFKSVKKYTGTTVVRRNNHYLFAGDKKVHLEDPEFEKYFDVYSTDQIEARYLLTSAFMNRMVQLAKKGVGENITLSFEQGNVNIAVASFKDWFEVPLFKPATDIQNYRGIILELISLLKIIDSLKMEQNIGL